MKDLSITQEYLVCAVNEKGKISGFNPEKLVSIVTAGLLELQLENCIFIDEKKVVSVTGELLDTMEYLRPLYDFIGSSRKMKLDKIVSAYNFTFTDKRLNELLEAIGDSLEKMEAAESVKAGIFGGRKSYRPKHEYINKVTEKVRSELLGERTVTKETAALVALLDKSKCLKLYFSSYERKVIKEKLAEISKKPEGKLVKEMIDQIEEMYTTMVVVIAACN